MIQIDDTAKYEIYFKKQSMPKITESNMEDHVIKLLESQNYTYLSPEDQEKERESFYFNL